MDTFPTFRKLKGRCIGEIEGGEMADKKRERRKKKKGEVDVMIVDTTFFYFRFDGIHRFDKVDPY